MDAALVLRWGAALVVLGAAGLPVARRAFPRSPRLAAAFALPAALVVLGLAAYWVGHVSFGPLALVVPALALLGVSAAAARVGDGAPAGRSWHPMALPWRRYAPPALVFAAGFGLLLAVRAFDPAAHAAGGEKFLDFGLLRAVLRADALPPEDLWFAGEPVRYYYGGALLASLLARLSATPPAEAYNLALATWYGALAAGAYALAGELAERAGRSARVGGATGAVFVALAGTLATPGRALLGLLSPDVAAEYGRALYVGIRGPEGQALEAARFLATGGYDYWHARYVIPDVPTVFPLWAVVNGDLRPHVASAPFLLLAAALCYAVYRAAGRRRRALLLSLGAVAGLLTLVNTWTLPTVVGLTWLALALGDAPPAAVVPARARRALRAPVRRLRRATATGALPGAARSAWPDGSPLYWPEASPPTWPARELRRAVVAAVLAAGVGLAGAALAAPYLLFNRPMSRGVQLLPPRSPPVPFLLAFGAFLAVLLPVLAMALRRGHRDLPAPDRPGVAGLFTVVPLVGLAGALALDATVAAVAGGLVLAGWLAVRRGALGYVGVLLVAGAGVVLATEFAVARVYPFDPAAPRWNTLYKAYWQVWLLWGVAAGAALARLVGRALDARTSREDTDAARRRPTRRRAPRLRGLAPMAAAALAVVALVGAGSFGAFALAAHFDDPAEHPGPHGTLDATAFVDAYHPDEAAAIEWLDDREGTPTVASAPGTRMYRWANAPSSLTGVPTVAGWRHEAGYRGEAAYRGRVEDLRRLYVTDDPAVRREVLARHDVEYVYVGPVERERYGDVALEAPWATVAHRSGNVTVYRVEPGGAG